MPWYQTLSLVAATAVALLGLPAALHQNYSVRLRGEHQVKRLLDLIDKLPEDVPGFRQVDTALRAATLDLAYVLQYPRTTKDRIRPVALGLVTAAAGFASVYISTQEAPGWIVIAILLIQSTTGYLFSNTLLNSQESTILTKRLFVLLNAPQGIKLGRPPIWKRVRQPAIEDVLEYAAHVRDRTTDREMNSVEAVNRGAELARLEVNQLFAKLRRLRAKRWTLQIATPLIMTPLLLVIFALEFRLLRKIKKIEKKDPERASRLRDDYVLNVRPRRDELTIWPQVRASNSTTG